MTEYILGLTEEGEHSLAGMVYKEEFVDHTQVEIVPESHPHITVTWIEMGGIIEKVGILHRLRPTIRSISSTYHDGRTMTAHQEP